MGEGRPNCPLEKPVLERTGSAQGDNAAEHLAVATVLVLRRWQDLIPFLRLTLKVKKQLKSTPGLVWYSVNADFWRRRFYTCSLWRDRASVNAFVQAEPHATAVGRMQAWSGPGTAFAEWNTRDASIFRKEALERLQRPTFSYRPPPGA
jgi:hypothetical protein